MLVVQRIWGPQGGELVRRNYNAFQRSLGSLPFKVNYSVCTFPGDPAENMALGLEVGVIRANLKSFSDSMNQILGVTLQKREYLLIYSGDVEIGQDQIMEALLSFQDNEETDSHAYTYSWQVQGMGNDGSHLGLMGYNTAMMYNTRLLVLLKSQVWYPEYVDNGMLGEEEFEIEGQKEKGPLGGAEEPTFLLGVAKQDPYAYSIHNAGVILPTTAQTGTDVKFRFKLARKKRMAEIYAAKFGLTMEDALRHYVVLR